MNIRGTLSDFLWESPLEYYDQWQSLCFLYNVSERNVEVLLNGINLETSENLRAALKNYSAIQLGDIFKVLSILYIIF